MSLSHEWKLKADKVIPGGVNSPVRSFKHVGVEPLFFERAEGPYLYDVDGKKYVDFCLSFGPHILGHSHPALVKAIVEQAPKGTTFGACHPREVELATWILKGYPFLDKVRLVNSGTEAVMTAVRLARGFTKRNKILMFEGCYHGHSDGLLAKAGSGVAHLSEASSAGVPPSIVEDTLTARLDDWATVENVFHRCKNEIAAVILEPIPANNGLLVNEKAFLEKLFKIAKEYDTLIIFDEVISGFRAGLSGAAGHFDMKPDLVTLGKIIGGGLPLAAVVGRKDIMDCLAPLGSVYQAGTLSGNSLATAAGCAMMEQLFGTQPYAELAERTQWFVGELRKLIPDAEVTTFASMFFPFFGPRGAQFPPDVNETAKIKYSAFFKAGLAAGVYFPPSPYEVSFISAAHTRPVLEGVLASYGRTKA